MPPVMKQRPTGPPTNPRPKAAEGEGWPTDDGLKVLLYGRSGTGKTTLWGTFPKPILALICSGGRRPGELRSLDTPANRKVIHPRIVRSTIDLKGLIENAADYATVVLDHASGLQDLTLKEILGVDELPAQKSWGMASQQQYGQCSLMCKEILRALLSLAGNVVIVAQERTFGEEGQGELIAPTVGAAMTPSVTGWLGPACDYVVQTYLRPRMEVATRIMAGKEVKTTTRGKGIEYCLRVGPHELFQTKFRVPKGTPLPEAIVDPDYAKIVALVRGEAVD